MKNTLFVFTGYLLSLSAYGSESSDDAKEAFQKARSAFQSQSQTSPQVVPASPSPSRVRTKSVVSSFESPSKPNPEVVPASPAPSKARTKSVASSFEHLPIMGSKSPIMGVTSPRMDVTSPRMDVTSPRATSHSPVPRRGSVPISSERLPSDSVPVLSSSPTEHSDLVITEGNTKSIRDMLKGDIQLRARSQSSGTSSSSRYSSSPETKETTFLSPRLESPQGESSPTSTQQTIKSAVEEREEKQTAPLEDIAIHNPGMPLWEDLVDITLPRPLKLEKVKERYDMYVPLKLNAGVIYDVTLDILNLQSFKYRVFERAYQQELVIPAFEKGLEKAKSLKHDMKKQGSSHKKLEKDLKVLSKKLEGELPAAQSKLDGIYSEKFINEAIDGSIKRILGVLGKYGLTREHLEALDAEKPLTTDEKAKPYPETSEEEDFGGEGPVEDKPKSRSNSDLETFDRMDEVSEILDAPLSAVQPPLSGSPTLSDMEDDAPTISQFPKFDVKRVDVSIDELRKRIRKKEKREITRTEAEDEIRRFLRHSDTDITALVDNYSLSHADFQFYELESKDLKRKYKE